MRLILIAIAYLLMPPAYAEYRVYKLAITNTQTGQSRTVVTTLDHLQYPGYYPLRKNEVVKIEETWKCWKRSDWFQGYCPPPSQQQQPAEPAPPTGK